MNTTMIAIQFALIGLRRVAAELGHRSISSTVRYTAMDSKRFAKLF